MAVMTVPVGAECLVCSMMEEGRRKELFEGLLQEVLKFCFIY